MKRLFFCTILVINLIGHLTAQTVDVIKRGKVSSTSPSKSFEFIESTTNLSQETFIGSIRAIGSDKTLNVPKLFFKLRSKAQDLGANSFKLNKFEKTDNPKRMVLILDIYLSRDSLLEANKVNHLNNSAIFFLDDENSDEVYEFYINEIARKVKSGSYFQYNIKSGMELVVSQTELFGSTTKFKWKENRPAIFITFTDFGLENKENESDYLGMFFNTKRINIIEGDLGYLLHLVLKRN